MNAFALKIVTPDGLKYDGQAEELIVRSTSGDIGILAGHVNCVVPLGMGRATIVVDGKKRYAACIGGMLSMLDGNATLVPTTFEWANEIDTDRVGASLHKAQRILDNKSSSHTDIRMAQARIRRALVRKSVSEMK